MKMTINYLIFHINLAYLLIQIIKMLAKNKLYWVQLNEVKRSLENPTIIT